MRHLVFIFFVCLCLMGCRTVRQHKENKYRCSSLAAHKKTFSLAVMTSACELNCEHTYRICLGQCHDSCLQCQKEADKQAWKNYQKYYKRMKVKGTYRPRDWLSFRDPLQCRNVSCNCIGDLTVCIQQCGGEIMGNE